MGKMVNGYQIHKDSINNKCLWRKVWVSAWMIIQIECIMSFSHEYLLCLVACNFQFSSDEIA